MERDIDEEMDDCYGPVRRSIRSAVDLDDPRARADFERMQRGEAPNPFPGFDKPPRMVSIQYWRGASWPSHFVSNAALVMAALALIFSIAALIASVVPAPAMDHGFSDLPQPHTPEMLWIETRKMPGLPPRNSSCCGKGDVYYADIYTRNPDGSYEAEITEGSAIKYPDGTYRPAIPNGTKFHVDAFRVNPPEDGNPTGHGIVFLGVGGEWGPDGKISNVWCFFPMPQGS